MGFTDRADMKIDWEIRWDIKNIEQLSTSYWKKVGRGKWWKNCRLSTCCSRTAKGIFFWIDLQKIIASAMPIFIAISDTQNWLKFTKRKNSSSSSSWIQVIKKLDCSDCFKRISSSIDLYDLKSCHFFFLRN